MADEWGAPEASDTPQTPRGLDKLLARLTRMERTVRDLPHQILRAARLKVETGVLRVLGAIAVDGDAEIAGTLGVTGDAEFSGDTTIGGNASITGTLSLPAGIIDNDALANPVVMRSAWEVVEGMAFPNASTDFGSASITVPAGFTRMTFVALGAVRATNDVGSTQYLLAQIRRSIDGGGFIYGGPQSRSNVPDGWSSTTNPTYMWSANVTPGEVHTWTMNTWVSGGAWSADSQNYVRMDITAIFTR